MTTPILALSEMAEGQSSKHVTFNEAINALEAAMFAKIASITAGMQAGDGKTDLYTVPASKKLIVTDVLIHSLTGSLAGGVDFSLGDGGGARNWKSSIDLSGLTSTSHYIHLTAHRNAGNTVYAAAAVFGIIPNTGATADVDAVVEVFGRLFT
jgi:hypothetical protein